MGRDVGLGHLVRCLALGAALQAQGARAHFVVDADSAADRLVRAYDFEGVGVARGDERDLRETAGHAKAWAARALVVDSYAISAECLAGLRVPVVVVIDDLADRYLPVALVVNGAVDAHELHYRTLPRTERLLGLGYVLLREEFAEDPKRDIRERVRRVLVTLGGADSLALTPQLIGWVRDALGDVVVDVVVGPFWTGEVQRAAEQAGIGGGVTLHRDPRKMRELMLACDIALAGGGQTLYELSATGTPTLAVRLSENQTGNLAGLSRQGAIEWVCDAADPRLARMLVGALQAVTTDRARREAMSRCGRRLVDGLGAHRVARVILEACET